MSKSSSQRRRLRRLADPKIQAKRWAWEQAYHREREAEAKRKRSTSTAFPTRRVAPKEL